MSQLTSVAELDSPELEEPVPPPVIVPPPVPAVVPPESAPQVPVAETPVVGLAAALRHLPSRMLRATPSWLVSMIGHLVLLLLLTCWTLVPPPQPEVLSLVSTMFEDLPTLTEPVAIVELKDLPQVNLESVSGEEMLSTTVGDPSQVSASAVSVSSADVETSAVGDVGDIFGSERQGMTTVAGGKMGAEFFGVKAQGRRFMFIVDSSNSMRGAKFGDAKRELLYAIQKLSKDQFFYVIFFDRDAARMTLAPSTEPEVNCVAATRENVGKFEQWMNSIQNELRTDPYDAVKFSVDLLPDAIYILSDGRFTDRGRTIRFLQANNFIEDPVTGKAPKVVIHTVGFHGKEGEETLQSIAKTYGGTYRFVPGPLGEKKNMKMAKK